MAPAAFAVIILTVVGGINAWVGHAIKHQRRYDLIAGFDPALVRDPDALARWIGHGAFALAAICAGGILGALIVPGALETVLLGVGVAVVAVVLITAGGLFGRRW